MRQDFVPVLNPTSSSSAEQQLEEPEYRARRGEIARLAMVHRIGEPAPEIEYRDDESALWATVRDSLAPMHENLACWEYRQHAASLALPHDEVPQLREISARLERLSGFKLVPGPGRHDPLAFIEYLAKGAIRCPQFLRPASCMEFSPQPDMVHGLLGHASLLASPALADLNRLFARRAKHAQSKDDLKKLARVYWFTMELGVVREGQDLKAYGAALLSSRAELRALSLAALRPLDLKAMESLELVATDVQHLLFCAPSFDEMRRALTQYLSL